MPQHPIAKDEPPKKGNKRQEEECQAELRCAQYRLKKCLEDEDYTKAAAVNKMPHS